MRGRIRFWLISLISFTTVTVGTIIIPGSFLNRIALVASCGILGFNSTFCTPNLEIEPDRAMATNTSALGNMQSRYSNLSDQESVIENQRNSILAFKPEKEGEGHWAITYAAIDGSDFEDESNSKTKFALHTPGEWQKIEAKGFSFTRAAREEIYQANRGVDLVAGSSIVFSHDFGIPENHFDNESFPQGSLRLITLKGNIINELTYVTDANTEAGIMNGRAAREYLGQALHTLQDFYAHSNWVELGKTEINKDLGRWVICNTNPGHGDTPPCSRPHNFVTEELGEPTAKGISVVDNGSWNGLRLDYDQGTLDPSLKELTSGYFMGLSSPCQAPPGKVRHGAALVCPDGLNKDDDSRTGYSRASALAVSASQDYIRQIIFEDPTISNNIEAIKALMGITDPPKDAPCNNPDNNCKATAHSTNDPHLTTFDGLKYDLQTVGEVILIKSNESAFEVQARQTSYNNSASLSINSAVAIKVGSDRVAVYAQGLPDADTTTPLRVNGNPTIIQGNKLALQGGGEILNQGSAYAISAPTGEKVLISSNGSFLNISPIVHNRAGKYSGLLGNVNGNPNDDLQTRGGSNILEVRSTYGDVNKVLNLVGLRAPGALDRAEQIYFDQLYKEFANSWRVKQEESLFDYPVGKTTESYINLGFPDHYLTLNMLSPDQIQKAQNACTEAKVTPDLMENCIFDVGFSGFSEFARTTAEISSYIGIANQLIPGLNIPTPNQVIDRPIEIVRPRICLPLIGCH